MTLENAKKRENLALERFKNKGLDKPVMFLLSQSKFVSGLHYLSNKSDYLKVKQLFFEGGLFYLLSLKRGEEIIFGERELCLSILSCHLDLNKSIYEEIIKKKKVKDEYLFYYLLFDDFGRANGLIEKNKGHLYNYNITRNISNSIIAGNSKQIANQIDLLFTASAIKERVKDRKSERLVNLYGLVFYYISQLKNLEKEIKENNLLPLNYFDEVPKDYFFNYSFLKKELNSLLPELNLNQNTRFDS